MEPRKPFTFKKCNGGKPAKRNKMGRFQQSKKNDRRRNPRTINPDSLGGNAAWRALRDNALETKTPIAKSLPIGPFVVPIEWRAISKRGWDDWIFECSCGNRRIYGKKTGGSPKNRNPLLICHEEHMHGGRLSHHIHVWVHDPDIQPGAKGYLQ